MLEATNCTFVVGGKICCNEMFASLLMSNIKQVSGLSDQVRSKSRMWANAQRDGHPAKCRPVQAPGP